MVDSSDATIHALKCELEQLNEQLKNKPNENERKIEIMDLLHKYNDIKDATQIIVGALATLEQVTIKEIHERLNLPLDS